jgi:hypothetical protein
MWLNVADVAGTPGLEINSEDLRKILSDWQWFSDALTVCARTGERLDDYVIQQASVETQVIERISRLILESCRNVPGRQAELRKSSGVSLVVNQLVRNQLHTVYPTQNPRREFALQFTRVCKLDYGKRFFSSLVDYCEGPTTSSERSIHQMRKSANH